MNLRIFSYRLLTFRFMGIYKVVNFRLFCPRAWGSARLCLSIFQDLMAVVEFHEFSVPTLVSLEFVFPVSHGGISVLSSLLFFCFGFGAIQLLSIYHQKSMHSIMDDHLSHSAEHKIVEAT